MNVLSWVSGKITTHHQGVRAAFKAKELCRRHSNGQTPAMAFIAASEAAIPGSALRPPNTGQP